MKHLSAEQKAFYKKVAGILREKWDPIGVNHGENESDEEYDNYVPHVFRLAIEGKDAQRIASFLSAFAEHNIGLPAARAYGLKVVDIIVKTKEEMLG